MAVPAITVYTAHPGNSYSRAQGQLCCRSFDHFSNDLMTRNKLRLHRRQISLDDVQVSAANSASNNSEQDMSGFKPWPGDIFNLKERPGRFLGR
jgi:hypothetical protein